MLRKIFGICFLVFWHRSAAGMLVNPNMTIKQMENHICFSKIAQIYSNQTNYDDLCNFFPSAFLKPCIQTKMKMITMIFLLFSSADLAGLACLAGLGWLAGMAWGRGPGPVSLSRLSRNYPGTFLDSTWWASVPGLAWPGFAGWPGWPCLAGLPACLFDCWLFLA